MTRTRPWLRCRVDAGRVGGRGRWLNRYTLLLLCMISGSATALITGTWTVTSDTSATSTVSGIAVAVSGATGNVGGDYTAGATFNTTNYWSNPYGEAVAGGPSLQVNLPFGFVIGRTITVAFDKPVDDPVMHVDRLGGVYQACGFCAVEANSSRWTLIGSSGGTVSSLTRLSGNPQFQVTGSSFQRVTGVTSANTGECTVAGPGGSNVGTACGSIRFNGAGISSLTFNVDPVGAGSSIGDGLELRFSFAGSSVVVRKQSNGGTAAFPFVLGNLVGGNPTLDTSVGNPIASTAFPVADHGQAITIAESAVAGYDLAGANCVDGSGATIASTLDAATRQLTIAAADYGASQTITCTFINDRQPTLRLRKSLPNGRFVATDQFALTIDGPGGPQNVTTGGSGSAVSGSVTLAAGTVGADYTLSESGASGANLGNYTTTYTCTNAYAGGSPDSSGNGAGFVLAPQAGDDLTCTFANVRNPIADLTIAKSNGVDVVIAGQPTTYTVVIGNNGPDAATGAVVRDPAVSGLVCDDPVPCAGAACPAPTVSLTDLQGVGVVLGTLVDGDNVTLSVTCTPP